MTTDPVCGGPVDEQETEFKTQFAGKKYFFCSEVAERNSRTVPRTTWR
jgi:YHS domain-containing protein